MTIEITMANRASSIVAGKYCRRSDEHCHVAVLGDPQVAVQQLPQVDQVLIDERLIEAVLMVESLDYGRIPEGALAQVGGGRVRRDQVGQDEGHQGDPDDEDDPYPEAPAQETPEPGGGYPPGSTGALYSDCGQLAPALSRGCEC